MTNTGFVLNANPGLFVPDSLEQTSYTYTGTLFRCIPISAAEPLSATYSLEAGGRWNDTTGPTTLYIFTAASSARSFVAAQAVYYGRPLEEWPPEDLPDLVVFTSSVSVTNVATDSGLAVYGLPPSYPVGYETPDAYAITQPIGQSIFASGSLGLVTRSATLTAWTGPMVNWAEIAIFTDHFHEFHLVDRYRWDAWFREN